MQLNTLSSLQRFMGKVEKTAIINSFIDALWFGIFVLGNLLKKLNTFKNVVLSLNLIAKVVMKLYFAKKEPVQWKLKGSEN